VLRFRVRDGKIVEIDAIADPARLRQLDLTVLDDCDAKHLDHTVRRGL